MSVKAPVSMLGGGKGLLVEVEVVAVVAMVAMVVHRV